MSLSNYLEDAFMNTLKNTSFAVAQLYASLHTADPGETGASEVVGGSYARQAFSLGAVSGGAASNAASITWSGMPACTVTHFAVWDALTNGNCLGSGTTTTKTLGSGDAYSMAAGDLDISVD